MFTFMTLIVDDFKKNKHLKILIYFLCLITEGNKKLYRNKLFLVIKGTNGYLKFAYSVNSLYNVYHIVLA